MTDRFRHEFVDMVPDTLNEGVLYVSLLYLTIAHLCACGCGSEVHLAISPVDWSFSFDGQALSLSPSVGNWSLPCRSHYWIIDGLVGRSSGWSQKRIALARRHDDVIRRRHYEIEQNPIPSTTTGKMPAALRGPSYRETGGSIRRLRQRLVTWAARQ